MCNTNGESHQKQREYKERSCNFLTASDATRKLLHGRETIKENAAADIGFCSEDHLGKLLQLANWKLGKRAARCLRRFAFPGKMETQWNSVDPNEVFIFAVGIWVWLKN